MQDYSGFYGTLVDVGVGVVVIVVVVVVMLLDKCKAAIASMER